MTERKITICGKEVGLAYCYATEIAFHSYSGQSVSEYLSESKKASDEGRMPDPGKSVYFVLAAIVSYYESRGEELPIKDTDLMYKATPTEMGNAIATLVKMFGEWYEVPAGEPEDKPEKGKKRKNA